MPSTNSVPSNIRTVVCYMQPSLWACLLVADLQRMCLFVLDQATLQWGHMHLLAWPARCNTGLFIKIDAERRRFFLVFFHASARPMSLQWASRQCL